MPRAHPLEPLDRFLDERIVAASETQRPQSERGDVAVGRHQRWGHLLDLLASPEGDQRIELRNQPLGVGEPIGHPLLELPLDFREIAARDGDLDARDVVNEGVTLHAKGFGTRLEPTGFEVVLQAGAG